MKVKGRKSMGKWGNMNRSCSPWGQTEPRARSWAETRAPRHGTKHTSLPRTQRSWEGSWGSWRGCRPVAISCQWSEPADVLAEASLLPFKFPMSFSCDDPEQKQTEKLILANVIQMNQDDTGQSNQGYLPTPITKSMFIHQAIQQSETLNSYFGKLQMHGATLAIPPKTAC